MYGNYLYGEALYGQGWIPADPPLLSVSHVTRYKISSILGFDVSTATFTADQDLTEFVARIGGYDHATGPLAYSGGALDEGDDGFAVVEHDDLVNLGDGDHRINIYGKNAQGLWTEYMNGGGEEDPPFWLEFEPLIYDDYGGSAFWTFETQSTTIPQNCELWIEVDSALVSLPIGGIGISWYKNDSYIQHDSANNWGNKSVEFSEGDELYFFGTNSQSDDDFIGTVRVHLDGIDGVIVGEFDFDLPAAPDCFLTTAMVGHYGKSDDGPELTAMRALRERYGDKHRTILAEYPTVSRSIIQHIEGTGQQEYYYSMIKDVVVNIVIWVEGEEWKMAENAYLDLYMILKEELRAIKNE